MPISFNQAIDIVAISVKKHKTILTITLSFVPFIDYTVTSFFLLISFLITLKKNSGIFSSTFLWGVEFFIPLPTGGGFFCVEYVYIFHPVENIIPPEPP